MPSGRCPGRSGTVGCDSARRPRLPRPRRKRDHGDRSSRNPAETREDDEHAPASGGTRRAASHGGGACRGGQGGARGVAARRAWRMGAGGRAVRPRRAARGAGRHAGPGARADPLRADARVALHLLSRRRLPDGGRSRRHAAHRPGRAALRRCAPVELRRLRRAGPAADLQHQRLRRDAARPVRVGREAARRQLRRRRPRPRLQRQAAPSGQPDGDPVLPRGDPELRADVEPRPLVLPHRPGGDRGARGAARRAGSSGRCSSATWPRRGRRTACGRSRSSRRSSTASAGS